VAGVLIIAATLTVGIRGRSEQAKKALEKFPSFSGPRDVRVRLHSPDDLSLKEVEPQCL